LSSWRDNWREELEARLKPHGIVGVAVGEGWKDLICDLVEKLDATGLEWKLHQVKEKFGTLRFYTEIEGGPSLQHVLTFADQKAKAEEFHKLIEAAEGKSHQTCEQCGKFGTRGTFGHLLQVACESCGQASEAERLKRERGRSS